MKKLPIVIAFVIAMTAPLAAQEAAEYASKPGISTLRLAMSEVTILRYRAALKLKAEQEKYWPAVASALRALAREPKVDENAVRRIAPAVTPLLATLDSSQRQTAMGIVQKAGLAQYASMF